MASGDGSSGTSLAGERTWDDHWKERGHHLLYPSEFAVRVFLQRAPGLTLRDRIAPGMTVLDVGFGDGRNFGLFRDLGLTISGTEISSDIVESGRRRFAGAVASLEVGRCARLPYPDAHFDFVYAVGVLFYVGDQEGIDDNLREVRRVLKPGGHMAFTLLREGDYLLRSSTQDTGFNRRVDADPAGVRNGQYVAYLGDADTNVRAIERHFTGARVFAYSADWFGLPVSRWLGVAHAGA